MAATIWALRPPPRSSLAPDADGHRQELAELALGHLLGRMTIDHVPDLVTEDARELGLVVHAVEQARGDEDLPAGQGEGVDRLRVAEQVEMEVLHVGALLRASLLRTRRRPTSSTRAARVLARIDVAPHLARHLGGGLEAQGHLLVDAHRDVLLLAGHRIDLRLAHVHHDADQRDDQRADQAADRQAPASLIS